MDSPTSGAGAASRVLLLLAALLAPAAGAQDRTFVQISDTHVGAAAGLPHLKLVLQQLEQLAPKPELVVVTGDLTEKGAADECARFAETIATWRERTGIAVLVAPGNHDARWTADPRTRSCDDGAPYPRVALLGDLGVMALDSTLSFGQHGHLSRRQLARAEELMREHPEVKDWVLALHHPPADGKFLDDEPGLAELCDRLPVTLVLTGHGHAHKCWLERGVPHVMAIGVMNPRFGYRRFRVTADQVVGTAVTLAGEQQSDRTDVTARRAAARPDPGPGAASRAHAASSPTADDGIRVRFAATFLAAPLVLGDQAVFAGEEGEVLALRPHDLGVVWRAQVAAPVWTSPFASGAELVVADGTPALRHFDRHGQELRRTPLPALATAIAAPETDGSRLLALGNGAICRWSPAGDAVRTLATLPAMTRTAPLRLGSRIVVPCWDRHVHVLDADSGKPLGRLLVHASFYNAAATATPLALGTRALLFGHDQRLLAFDPERLAFTSAAKLEGVQPAYAGGVQLDGDRVLLGSMDGALAVVDLAQSAVVARVTVPGAVFDSTPLVDGDRAWVGTMQGHLACVALEPMRVVRSYPLGGYVVADPVVSGARVLAAATTGVVLSVPR